MRQLSRSIPTTTKTILRFKTISTTSRSSNSSSNPSKLSSNPDSSSTSTSTSSTSENTSSNSTTPTTPSPTSSIDDIEPQLESSTSTLPATSASSFLLAQARIEEAEESNKRKSPRLPQLDEVPWEGEETQERLIRRILEDSYKPLRVKGFVKQIPTPEPLPSSLFVPPTIPTEVKEIQYPWQAKFKAPDSYRPISRSQTFLQNSKLAAPTVSKSPLANSQRLASAVERSRDYESGFSKRKSLVPDGYGAETEVSSRAKGNSARGSSSSGGFVEQKIQEAIRNGLFKSIEGRGKPMVRDVEAESNPFISRDDFLINRIVKQQGASPPWIQLQGGKF